jgi:putative endonuclease
MESDEKNYYVYIVTNENKTELETGTAGVLDVELHYLESRSQAADGPGDGAKCIYLIYWEKYKDVFQALDREREINKLSAKKKEALINKTNPGWRFLNEEVN